MFSEQEIQSLNTDQIKLQNLVVYKLSDEGLRKNFQAAIDNFKKIENKFLNSDRSLQQQVQAIITEAEKKYLTLQLKLLTTNTELQTLKLAVKQLQQGHKTTSMNLSQKAADLSTLFFFKGLQEQTNETNQQHLQAHNQRLQQSQNEIKKATESIARKTDKMETEKMRKTITNNQLKLETISKKTAQIEERITATFVHEEEQKAIMDQAKKLIGQKRVKSIMKDLVQIHRQDQAYCKGQEVGLSIKSASILNLQQGEKRQNRLINTLRLKLLQDNGKSTKVQPENSGRYDQLRQIVSQLQKKVAALETVSQNNTEREETTRKEDREEVAKLQTKLQTLSEMQKYESLLKTKIDQLQDKFFQQDKRQQSLAYMIDSLDSKIKNQNTMRFDDRLKEIQVNLITKFSDIHNKLDNKLESLLFHQSLSKSNEEIKKLASQLDHKTEKVHMKKALNYLEVKLKELADVVKNQEENVRNALVSKKLLKCLSCDRQLQRLQTAVNVDNKTIQPFFPTQQRMNMTQTRFLKKRVRQMEQI